MAKRLLLRREQSDEPVSSPHPNNVEHAEDVSTINWPAHGLDEDTSEVEMRLFRSFGLNDHDGDDGCVEFVDSDEDDEPIIVDHGSKLNIATMPTGSIPRTYSQEDSKIHTSDSDLRTILDGELTEDVLREKAPLAICHFLDADLPYMNDAMVDFLMLHDHILEVFMSFIVRRDDDAEKAEADTSSHCAASWAQVASTAHEEAVATRRSYQAADTFLWFNVSASTCRLFDNRMELIRMFVDAHNLS